MKAELFVYTEGDSIGFYPYMKTDIERDWLKGKFCDIETVYGYGGPIINSYDKGFISRFEAKFEEYCIQDGIIAAFVRFHPIIRNESVFTGYTVIHNRITVSVDLTQDINDIWMNQISTSNRNVIRKCVKNGLTVEESEDYQSFFDIYRDTMDKVGAESFYYLNSQFFDDMKKDDHYRLLVCKLDDVVLAAAVFMEYGDYFHYHFAGSKKEALKYSPNNLLLWDAIKYGKERGHKVMHLGGGLTDSEDDNLFRFKARFSRNRNDFYIGKRVYNVSVYNALIDEWEQTTGQKAVKLLQYKE